MLVLAVLALAVVDRDVLVLTVFDRDHLILAVLDRDVLDKTGICRTHMPTFWLTATTAVVLALALLAWRFLQHRCRR